MTEHHYHTHIHHHSMEARCEVMRRLDALSDKIDLVKGTIMPTLDDLKTTLDTIDGKVTTVKTDVDTLLAKLAAIPTPGLTAEQQQAIDDAVAHANGIAASLGAIDTTVNPPAAT